MTRFTIISSSAATVVAALDAYFAIQIVNGLNPYSLNCASSSIIMFMRTQRAASLLIPTLVAGLVAFEFSRRHFPPVWRIAIFIPIAAGIALLVVTKLMSFW